MSEWTPFNLNAYIRVKLTQSGKVAYLKRRTTFITRITLAPEHRPDMSREPFMSDGYLVGPMWAVMMIYAPMMFRPGEEPFDGEFVELESGAIGNLDYTRASET